MISMKILIPSTFSAEERDKKIQVKKIDLLARAASIFGVETIIIYKDKDPKVEEEENAKLLEKYLLYAETPPYLRKKLIPYDPDLKYANILSPLLIPSHGYSEKYREAYIKEKQGEKAVLDAGLEEDLVGNMPEEEKGERVTIKRLGETKCKRVSEEEIPGFWTFTIKNYRESLHKILKRLERHFIIGTARKGGDIREQFNTIKNRDLSGVAIVFGSAWRGLYDLMERGDLRKEDFDLILNTIPNQTTRTVRTEEAIFITLGILNVLT